MTRSFFLTLLTFAALVLCASNTPVCAYIIFPSTRDLVPPTQIQTPTYRESLASLYSYRVPHAVRSTARGYDRSYARHYVPPTGAPRDVEGSRYAPTPGGRYGEMTPLGFGPYGAYNSPNASIPSRLTPNRYGGMTTLGPTPTPQGWAPGGMPIGAPMIGSTPRR
ncbi:MAG: hypothetical protein Q4G03_02205 [Planctomycetia bacterium]|nr:hypothetical protein [Planctomycetia bacterium]